MIFKFVGAGAQGCDCTGSERTQTHADSMQHAPDVWTSPRHA